MEGTVALGSHQLVKSVFLTAIDAPSIQVGQSIRSESLRLAVAEHEQYTVGSVPERPARGNRTQATRNSSTSSSSQPVAVAVAVCDSKHPARRWSSASRRLMQTAAIAAFPTLLVTQGSSIERCKPCSESLGGLWCGPRSIFAHRLLRA